MPGSTPVGPDVPGTMPPEGTPDAPVEVPDWPPRPICRARSPAPPAPTCRRRCRAAPTEDMPLEIPSDPVMGMPVDRLSGDPLDEAISLTGFEEDPSHIHDGATSDDPEDLMPGAAPPAPEMESFTTFTWAPRRTADARPPRRDRDAWGRRGGRGVPSVHADAKPAGKPDRPGSSREPGAAPGCCLCTAVAPAGSSRGPRQPVRGPGSSEGKDLTAWRAGRDTRADEHTVAPASRQMALAGAALPHARARGRGGRGRPCPHRRAAHAEAGPGRAAGAPR